MTKRRKRKRERDDDTSFSESKRTARTPDKCTKTTDMEELKGMMAQLMLKRNNKTL